MTLNSWAESTAMLLLSAGPVLLVLLAARFVEQRERRQEEARRFLRAVDALNRSMEALQEQTAVALEQARRLRMWPYEPTLPRRDASEVGWKNWADTLPGDAP
jgi:hypothetical protein